VTWGEYTEEGEKSDQPPPVESAQIDRWLRKNDDKLGAKGLAKKSNITDNESAKMPSSHGVVQGYNGAAAVDEKHQVIVHAEAFSDGTDNAL